MSCVDIMSLMLRCVCLRSTACGSHRQGSVLLTGYTMPYTLLSGPYRSKVLKPSPPVHHVLCLSLFDLEDLHIPVINSPDFFSFSMSLEWSTPCCARFCWPFKIHICVFCFHVCLCTMYVPGTCRGHKRALDPRELQKILSCRVSAGS